MVIIKDLELNGESRTITYLADGGKIQEVMGNEQSYNCAVGTLAYNFKEGRYGAWFSPHNDVAILFEQTTRKLESPLVATGKLGEAARQAFNEVWLDDNPYVVAIKTEKNIIHKEFDDRASAEVYAYIYGGEVSRHIKYGTPEWHEYRRR